MSFQFNADAIEDNGSQDWQPIPEGVYEAKVKDVEEKQGKNAPFNPYWKVVFEIVAGKHAGKTFNDSGTGTCH